MADPPPRSPIALRHSIPTGDLQMKQIRAAVGTFPSHYQTCDGKIRLHRENPDSDRMGWCPLYQHNESSKAMHTRCYSGKGSPVRSGSIDSLHISFGQRSSPAIHFLSDMHRIFFFLVLPQAYWSGSWIVSGNRPWTIRLATTRLGLIRKCQASQLEGLFLVPPHY